MIIMKDLKFYKDLFEKNIKKKMICTNPDLIVDRGKLENFVQVLSQWFLKKWVEK